MQAGAIARSNDTVWRCITTDIVSYLRELQAMVQVFTGVSFLGEGSEDLYFGPCISTHNFYVRKLRA